MSVTTLTDDRPTVTRRHRSDLSDLFDLAVSGLLSGAALDRHRYAALVRWAAVAHPQWTSGFLRWLRTDPHLALTDAALIGALEAARAMVDVGLRGARQLVDAALQRADEPGRALAYWQARFGRSLPKPVKRGIADAVVRLYDEHALLAHDTGRYRFADVLELVHPRARDERQGALFRYALDRRHGREDRVSAYLTVIHAHRALRTHPRALLAAGLTWHEALARSRPDARWWSAFLPGMPLPDVLEQLPVLATALDAATARGAARLTEAVAARIAAPDPTVGPVALWSAVQAAPPCWRPFALDALTPALDRVPALPGRTLIVVDAPSAAFGAALALRAARPTLVGPAGEIPVDPGTPLPSLIGQLSAPGSPPSPLCRYGNHDRVVTTALDSTALDSTALDSTALDSTALDTEPVGDAHWHRIGAPSDAALHAIPLIEAGQRAEWPWLPVTR